MHFRAAVSVALLACASHVAATAKPYKLAMMPIEGMSLMRRDNPGYQPEQTVCHDGETCAEACGEGYTTCPSHDQSTHCFNPAKDQTCCSDGSGNSCDTGYYCTHDTTLQTWCCPDEMDLVQCAAAYSVTGGLETPEATTSTPVPTSTSTSTSTTVVVTSTSSTPLTTSTPTPSSTHLTTSSHAVTKTKTKVEKDTTTVDCPSSSGYTTQWSGGNSTISTAVPTQPTESAPVTIITTATSTTTVPPEVTGAANAKGVSALLLAAAGVLALL
ncbi:Fc.00g090440.m01.CDS01 [Cosmosporella sp. VM-42]